MTPEELAKLRLALAAARFQPDRASPEYAFQRGWNACLDFLKDHLPPKENNNDPKH